MKALPADVIFDGKKVMELADDEVISYVSFEHKLEQKSIQITFQF